MDIRFEWVKTREPKPVLRFDFLLTNFIYPLKEPLVISKELGLILDNLRTDEEIKFFEEAVRRAVDKKNKLASTDSASLKDYLEYFREVFEPTDPFVEEFFQGYNYDQPERQVAKMLVVLRFNSDRNSDNIKKQHKSGIKNLDLDGEEIDGEMFVLQVNRDNAINYSYLLSLLIHKRNRYFEGESFLVNPHNFYVLNKRLKSNLNKIISSWLYGTAAIKTHISNNTNPQTAESHDWGILSLYLNRIKEVSGNFDFLFKQGKEEQLIYVGELIKESSFIFDERTKLIALVSAIELLLTHNPDNNRFNVEDSITKQFVLKTAIIVYGRDKSKEIDSLGARLKEIYTQRSNIAHGNFNEFNKFLTSLEKRSNNDMFFVSLIEDCYWFLKLITEAYCEDYQYINFLKKL